MNKLMNALARRLAWTAFAIAGLFLSHVVDAPKWADQCLEEYDIRFTP